MEDKVTKYEAFLNETLREDLKNVCDSRDEIYSEMSEYLKLKGIIEKLKETKENYIKTKVDLGSNFYVNAKVDDISMICVKVGFGFFVEFTLDEAVRFIDRKLVLLGEKAESLTKKMASIKAHIKVVLQGLRELQSYTNEKDDYIVDAL